LTIEEQVFYYINQSVYTSVSQPVMEFDLPVNTRVIKMHGQKSRQT